MSPNRLFLILYFLFSIWGILVLGINQSEINSYSLQKNVTRHFLNTGSLTLRTLEEDEKHPVGEKVVWKDKVLPFKQPGIFLFSALPIYFYKMLFETTGMNEFAFAIAVTSSLSVAITSLLVFFILHTSKSSLQISLIAAITCGLGTTLSAYAGTIHHDTIATLIVFGGYYLLFHSQSRKKHVLITASGFLLTFFSFFSLSLTAIAGVCILGAFYQLYSDKKITEILLFIFGLTLGIVPILLYQYIFFDSPFRTANHVYAITHGKEIFAAYNVWSMRLFVYFHYLGIVNLYLFIPAATLGSIGLVSTSFRKTPMLKGTKLIVLALLSHIIFIVFIVGSAGSYWGYGDAQFGPRYWIGAMPFMCLGIPTFVNLFSSVFMRRALFTLVIFASLWSIAINQIGLHLGTMHNNPDRKLDLFYRTYVDSLIQHSFETPLMIELSLSAAAIIFVLGLVQINFYFWSKKVSLNVPETTTLQS